MRVAGHVYRDDPLRSPSWRWEIANSLHSDSVRSERTKDTAILRAADFVRSLASDRDEPSQSTRNKSDLAVRRAYEIWKDAGSIRWAIEARILAAESFESIAKKCGTLLETIIWYEKLFFNVLDRLDAHYYIVCTVIGSEWHEGLTEKDYPVIWKAYGFFAGPEVLDFVITGFAGEKKPEQSADIDAFLAADIRSSVMRRAVIAARMNSSSDKNRVRLLAQLFRLSLLDQSRRTHDRDHDRVHDDINRNINATVENWPVELQKPARDDDIPELHLFEPFAANPGLRVSVA